MKMLKQVEIIKKIGYDKSGFKMLSRMNNIRSK